jgi:hypothetical protein
MVKDSPDVLALMPEAQGFDRHAPEHVAPLVAYLSSDICRFTARIFAIEGPDVAIYQPFGVEQDWSTPNGWTVDALNQTFSQINERSSTRAFFPGGVVHHNTPSGRTIKNLIEFEN